MTRSRLRKEIQIMKTMTRTRIILSIATIFLTGVFALPAAAQQQVAVTGEVQGQEHDIAQGGPPPTTISVKGILVGQATHIGRFSLAYQETVNLPAGNATGTATLTTQNGDMIFTTNVGQGFEVPNTPIATVMELNVITGGTGQFKGVSGYLIVYRLVQDFVTGLTSGSIVGSLTLAAK
jgi:hypothetical protein